MASTISGPLPTAARPLVNFDYVDISTGTGYREYYGGALASGALHSYRLSDNVFYSDKVSTIAYHSSSPAEGVYTKRQDLDFDLKFALPQIVDGTAIIVVPHSIFTSNVGKTVTGFVNVRIRKWDGSNVIEIAQASGAVVNVPGSDSPKQHQAAIKVICPRTKFKKGDTIRVTAEHYINFNNDNTSCSYAIGHDPKSRTYVDKDRELNWASAASVMSCQIPFKVDITG